MVIPLGRRCLEPPPFLLLPSDFDFKGEEDVVLFDGCGIAPTLAIGIVDGIKKKNEHMAGGSYSCDRSPVVLLLWLCWVFFLCFFCG
jgi:hypothetical protein